jgi:hypothetical protein
MLAQYLERLSKEANLEDELQEEETGGWSFLITERLSLSLKEKPDGAFLLTTELGPVPSRIDRLEDMLQSNLGSKGTLGANLGIDQSGTKSVLWRQVPPRADYEWFCNELEDFANASEYWSYFVRGEEMPE